MVDVAHEEVPGRGEALRQLGVDQLVDHDPRRNDPARQPVAKHAREDDQAGEPEPDRDSRERARRARGRGLGPTVAGQAELVEALGELGGEGRPRLDPDLRCGVGDLVDDGVRDDGPAGRLFERGRIALGNVTDVVFAQRVLAGGVAHRVLGRLACGKQLERRRERRNLVLVDGHLEGNVVRELRKPADVADDERTPERQRADDAAGGLAHGRRP